MNKVTDGLYSKKIEKGMIENATPENSVLVYWLPGEPESKFWFKDTKSDWEATAESEFTLMYLPPVHKGANLKLIQGGAYRYGQHDTATKNINITTWVPVVNKEEFSFKVPKDKSLVFMGLHSVFMPGSDTFEGRSIAWEKYTSENLVAGSNPKTQEEYDWWMKKGETMVLKNMLKKFKGTAWEPVLKERLAEATAELKAMKK